MKYELTMPCLGCFSIRSSRNSEKLRNQVQLIPLNREIKTIAGADISFNKFSDIVYACLIVFSFPDFKEIDHVVVKTITKFPYIPGLLSFREIPGLLEAWNKLKTRPDLIMVDGQGICHPRRLGIATHFGIVANIPTIGAAKSLLTGTFEEPPHEAGTYSYIYDRYNKTEIIGAAVRTKNKVKPMIISPGHLITLEQSIDIVLQSIKKYKMPEPTRQAHLLVNDYRKKDLMK